MGENSDWKVKYLDTEFNLYIQEQERINRARRLKMANLPEKIYKYREFNPRSKSNFKNNKVWASSPTNFNDPYDTIHKIDIWKVLSTDKIGFEQTLKSMELEFNLTHEQLKIIREKPQSLDDEVIKNLVEEGDNFPQELKNHLRSLFENRSNKNLIEKIESMTMDYGICSFTTEFGNMLMWSHYANYHQGFCIEYESKQISSNLYPVIYTENLIDMTEYRALKLTRKKNLNGKYHMKPALFKNKVWEYENEWRLVLDQCNNREIEVPNPTAVYFGSKCNLDSKDVKEIVRHCKEHNIKTFKMNRSANEFKIYEKEIFLN